MPKKAVAKAMPKKAVAIAMPKKAVASRMAEVASSSSDESSSDESSIPLSFSDRLTGRRVSLALVAHGKLQSRQQLYAHIMRPLLLMQAAAWFFARQSPGMKRHREEPPPPLGHMLAEFSSFVPVRVMCGCVATACRRVATAPAGMYVMYRTTGRWAAWIMERVTRGHVKKVQVRLQRRACCAVRCACRASACVCFVFDACCRKRWLVFRSIAAHRRVCIMRAVAFYFCVQAAAAARVAGGPDIVESARTGDGVSVLCHVIADADGVNKRDIYQ